MHSFAFKFQLLGTQSWACKLSIDWSIWTCWHKLVCAWSTRASLMQGWHGVSLSWVIDPWQRPWWGIKSGNFVWSNASQAEAVFNPRFRPRGWHGTPYTRTKLSKPLDPCLIAPGSSITYTSWPSIPRTRSHHGQARGIRNWKQIRHIHRGTVALLVVRRWSSLEGYTRSTLDAKRLN